jgi:sigma-E factor negative regulatory protein RseC
MLEETARVIHVNGEDVWVETERKSTCASCTAQHGCGTSTLSKVLGKRRSVMRVLSSMDLQPGDRVVLGIREQALVRGSVAVYAVPIVVMLLGALGGELGAQQNLWNSGETASMILGLGGLLAGLYWLARFTRNIRDDRDYQPVVLRKLTSAGAHLIAERDQPDQA